MVLWESWLMLVPRFVPDIKPSEWLVLWTPAYGPPFAGTAPLNLDVVGSRLGLGQEALNGSGHRCLCRVDAGSAAA